MKKADIDISICGTVAKDLSLDRDDVRNAVVSYFGSIMSDARKLPFNEASRIFTKDKFDSLSSVYNLPFLGRIGPSYSRYLKWRSNTVNLTMKNGCKTKSKILSEDDIERLADAILSGSEIPEIQKKPRGSVYGKVWLVGKNGKKLARQIIVKEKQYVQD